MNILPVAFSEQEPSYQSTARPDFVASLSRYLLVFALFALLASSMNAWANPVKIMPLGDSITQENNTIDSYRRPLWNMLNNAGYSVDFVGSHATNYSGLPPNPDFDLDNEGHWGWRADELLASLPSWLTGYTPDIVLMHVGTNDAFQKQSTSSTISELEDIIDLIRTQNPNVVILLAQLIPAAEAGRAARVAELNEAIPSIVINKFQAQSPIYLVDQNTDFFVSDLRDGVHANESGQNKLAAKWFEALSTVLSSADVTAPTVRWLKASDSADQISFFFSEEVSQATAENLANYQLSAGSISGASLAADNKTVTLDVTGLQARQVYTLTINNIADLANPANTIAANTQETFMLPVASAGRVSNGLQAYYRFLAGTGATVYDVSGTGIPLNLGIDEPTNTTWIAGGGLTLNSTTFIGMQRYDAKLKDSLQATNEISIEAWVKPINLTQTGPARIVTFSADGYNRNFTLGQRDSRYEARLRTTDTNNNGSSVLIRTGSNVIDGSLAHVVYTRNAAGLAELYQNGVLISSRTITGTFDNWSPNYVFGLGDEAARVNRAWRGDYRLVAVYDRALSASEVQQNFSAGLDSAPTNIPPQANAGSDQTVSDSNSDGSEAVTLNGSASSDDISVVSYQWYQSGSLIAEGATPTVNLNIGVHTLTLVVTDNEGLTDSDDVIITVEVFTDLTPPTAPGAISASNIGETALTLNWTAATDPESGIAAYRLHRDGVFIAQTTTTQYNDSALSPQTSYEYSIVAVNGTGLQGTSSDLTVQTTLDDQAPVLVSVEVNPAGNGLVLSFDEVLEQSSAENLANYQLSPSVAITSAQLQPDMTTVHLSLGALDAGVSYTLTLSGVLDVATTPNSSAGSIDFTYNNDPRVYDGLVVLYEFSAGSGSTVFDVSGVGTPMNLDINLPANTEWIPGGGLTLNAATFIGMQSDTKLRDRVQASNEITIEAWIRPENTTQTGPARIVTFSLDGYNRNFTLGQRDSRYETRLRTTSTNNNGSNIYTRTGSNVVDTSLSHVVYTRKANGEAELYENGILVASRTVGGTFANWNESYVFGLGDEATTVSRPWLGDYHLVAVYDRALTSVEVQQNFNVGVDSDPTDIPPQANAGSDQTVLDSNADGSEPVSLNGSASSDDIAVVSYQWFESGSLIAEGATPTINLNIGVHTLTLVVTDNEGLTDSDDVVITVEEFTDLTPPTAPGALSATNVGETSLTINWGAATDAESGIAGYRLYRDGAFVLETVATQYNDTGLTPAASYQYSVIAVNGAGLEGASSALTVQTLLDDQAPALLSVEVNQSGNGLVLSFNEELEQSSAEFTDNYQITPSIAITSAQLQADKRTVHLGLSPLEAGVNYTLSVSGVLDVATTPNSSNDSAIFSHVVGLRVNNGLVTLYEFSAGTGSTVYDVSGVGTPMNLNINQPANTTWIPGGGLTLNAATFIGMQTDTKLKDSVQATNEITIEAWVRPANTTQTGPARIVTFSIDGYNRNFTLGQRDSRYEVRLRTTSTNNNGSNRNTRTASNVVDTSLSHIVYTRKANGEAVLYENGILVASKAIPGTFANWNASYVFGLGDEATTVSRAWLGDYHLVAVYDRALTIEEVQQNYDVGVD